MALTTTTLNGTIVAGIPRLTLTAFTNPATAGLPGAGVLLKFATGEICLVSDATVSPTLGVVRGYDGTAAQAHTTGEAVVYGNASEPGWAADPLFPVFTAPVINMESQEITITGSTGSTAANVTINAPGFLNATGTSGAGLNLPVPIPGMQYWVKNNTTGVCKVYSVGATINGTTGTTAVSISATGTLAAGFLCATAGAWQVVPSAT
jgi:hypothetical protein